MLRQALQMLLQARMAGLEVLDERCTVPDLDQHTAKMAMQGEAFWLGFNRSDGAFQFRNLVADGGDLLTGGLDFTDDNLQPLKFAHGPRGGEVPQERGGCETTSSAAMSERSAVFITALRSLIRASPKDQESCSPSTWTSCSVLKHATRARCKAGAAA